MSTPLCATTAWATIFIVGQRLQGCWTRRINQTWRPSRILTSNQKCIHTTTTSHTTECEACVYNQCIHVLDPSTAHGNLSRTYRSSRPQLVCAMCKNNKHNRSTIIAVVKTKTWEVSLTIATAEESECRRWTISGLHPSSCHWPLNHLQVMLLSKGQLDSRYAPNWSFGV